MKDYENDLNYLKEQFSKDDLTVPDSLSEDAVFAMLENVPQMQPAAPPAVSTAENTAPQAAGGRTKRFRWYKPAAAIAACLCLALGIAAIHPWDNGSVPVSTSTRPAGYPDPGEPPAILAEAMACSSPSSTFRICCSRIISASLALMIYPLPCTAVTSPSASNCSYAFIVVMTLMRRSFASPRMLGKYSPSFILPESMSVRKLSAICW